MKHALFISYSNLDIHKVKLIEQELEGHILFYPLIIAENREALKPLAQKVSEGIKNSEVVIPIITSQSIGTQWINQEIGFATAIGKKIRPIVEKNLIDSLKGFIHKQIDLPYNFPALMNKEFEEPDFLNALRMLISDLEKEFSTENIKPLPEKTEFEKNLDKIDDFNSEIEYKNNRVAFLDSKEGVDAAHNHTLDMFNNLKEKIKILVDKKGFTIPFEEEQSEPVFVFRSFGFSCSIRFKMNYYNSLTESMLHVQYFDGNYTLYNSRHEFSQPKRILENIYDFDRNQKQSLGWVSRKDKQFYDSNYIVDNAIKWLIESIANKKLGK